MAPPVSPVYLKRALCLQKCHQLDDSSASEARFFGEAPIGEKCPAGLEALMASNELQDLSSGVRKSTFHPI
jgi:hypothetical protein